MKRIWWIALALAGCAAEPSQFSTTVDDLTAMPADAIAAPGDYDGDGCTDIGAKGSNGIWYIKYCANGPLGAWDAAFAGYGDNTAIPVPADYDGDGLTDLAIKDSTGMWAIDYAANGFGVFDVQVYGYGNSLAVPVPADYDGDGKADISVKDSGGMWGVDYAADGFNGWNDMHPAWNYGGSNWIPVPGNYDGNGHCSLTRTQACSLSSQCPSGEKCFLVADLAVKTDTGDWYIDKSNNGPGGPCRLHGCTQWDIHVTGYGNASAVPVPADYDHDGYTDLGIKDSGGTWYIDYATISNTGGPCTTLPATPCFGGWNMIPSFNYGAARTAVPGNYTKSDGDAQLDLAAKDNSTGYWYIDDHSNGYTGWDLPYIDDVGRPSVQNPNEPNITATKLIAPDGTWILPTNGRYNLTIGIRYTVEVTVAPGDGTLADLLFVQMNTAAPQFQVPPFLNLENPFAPSNAQIQTTTHRRFSIECSDRGAGMLGFELRDGGVVFNRDYGIVVACNSPADHPTGLHGVVTARGCSQATCGTGRNAVCGSIPASDGHYTPGNACPLNGATISVPGFPSVTSTADGSWSMPGVTGGNHAVTVTCLAGSCTSPCSGSSGPRSKAIAVNVTVPAGGGIEIDTPLEEQFFGQLSPVQYTTYIDYSRGRTVFHSVAIDLMHTGVRALRNSAMRTLVDLANLSAAPVLMNGAYYDTDANTHPGSAVGYFYTGGASSGCAGFASLGACSTSGQACYVDASDVWYLHACDKDSDCNGFGTCFGNTCGHCTSNANCIVGTCSSRGMCSVPGQCGGAERCSTVQSTEVVSTGSLPMLTIQGMTSGSQTLGMVETDGSFWSSGQFTLTGSPPCPIYNVASVDYAVQGVGALVENGAVIPPLDPNDVSWARTAVGFVGTTAFYVVADGEGVNGGHGATWHQLAEFFQQQLGAAQAMMLDGGGSTELTLRGATMGGTRHVNTYASENHAWDIDPLADPPGFCPNEVGNYFSAGL